MFSTPCLPDDIQPVVASHGFIMILQASDKLPTAAERGGEFDFVAICNGEKREKTMLSVRNNEYRCLVKVDNG